MSYDTEQNEQAEYEQSSGALYVASVTRPELSQCLFAGSCAIKAVKHGAKASAVTTKMADKSAVALNAAQIIG